MSGVSLTHENRIITLYLGGTPKGAPREKWHRLLDHAIDALDGDVPRDRNGKPCNHEFISDQEVKTPSVEVLVDLLWPGVRSWQGRGAQVEDFYARDGTIYVRSSGGAEHTIATAEEIADDSYKELFNPRMQALTLAVQPAERDATRCPAQPSHIALPAATRPASCTKSGALSITSTWAPAKPTSLPFALGMSRPSSSGRR